MRFKPYLHRPEKLEFNSRKESLFARKQQREANALPLFSDQIREQQHDWESEKRKRQSKSDGIIVAWRAREAALWRKARKMYFALPEDLRAQCKQDWVTIFRGAWTNTNLIYVVEKYNGIGDQRRSKFNAEKRAMDLRIQDRLSRQSALI
ncbi:hypothetical protein LCGC14_0170670 [marine sediment metagenome]|jgi:hypothetical protein|uniref:Uncharacterized protein n=1 Tax=marine sediment metagenome TaxID=412755 RepID=A0A0F9XUY7_9ZZZZ|nr:hypothetical protein [Oceanospirillaceae bacterium]|tara:strand:+ start:12085 stop:12534 length:450 start_codon:yes stop_codon:yes gene_type:complete